MKESDIDLANGIIHITHNKEKRPKKVYLLYEDIEIIKSFPRAIHLDQTYFFRHGKIKGLSEEKGKQFGKDCLYK